jgi:hypothetical protein
MVSPFDPLKGLQTEELLTNSKASSASRKEMQDRRKALREDQIQNQFLVFTKVPTGEFLKHERGTCEALAGIGRTAFHGAGYLTTI